MSEQEMKKRKFTIIVEVEDYEAPEITNEEHEKSMKEFIIDEFSAYLAMTIKKIEVKCEDAQQ